MKKIVFDNTPLEEYKLRGREITVKREDLCSPLPGPSFSKIRGVVAHIKNRPEQTIGVLDTFHSKAGWAVSYVCKALGRQAVNYWPKYKADREFLKRLPRSQQRRAEKMGADMVALPAGRSCILYHAAKKHLAENYEDSYLMPNALKLPESVTENAKEAVRTADKLPDKGHLIISISSGTVAAGILKGFRLAGKLKRYHVVLHLGYSRSIKEVEAYIQEHADLTSKHWKNIDIIDEGYDYKDEVNDIEAPFPCNPHYDLKAWKWLKQNVKTLKGPVVFWNIGD